MLDREIWKRSGLQISQTLLHQFNTAATASQKRMAPQQFKKEYTGYPYIPFGIDSFVENIRKWLKPGITVVDVGCGAGDKLYAFHQLEPSLEITGIEYDPILAETAKQLCGTFSKIIHGDALQQDYATYDLIYMYRPLIQMQLQSELQNRVMSQMKRGARLVVMLQAEVNTQHGREFPLLHGWRKIKKYDPKAGREVKIPNYWK